MPCCINCGAENDEGMMFCFNCGNNINSAKNKSSAIESIFVESSTKNTTKHYSKSSVSTGKASSKPYLQQKEKTEYATAALILGIISLFFSMLYLSPIAIILGIIGRKRAPSVKSRATAGMIMGIIGFVILIAILILTICFR